jgi:hypothetical protein
MSFFIYLTTVTYVALENLDMIPVQKFSHSSTMQTECLHTIASLTNNSALLKVQCGEKKLHTADAVFTQ